MTPARFSRRRLFPAVAGGLLVPFVAPRAVAAAPVAPAVPLPNDTPSAVGLRITGNVIFRGSTVPFWGDYHRCQFIDCVIVPAESGVRIFDSTFNRCRFPEAFDRLTSKGNSFVDCDLVPLHGSCTISNCSFDWPSRKPPTLDVRAVNRHPLT